MFFPYKNFIKSSTNDSETLNKITVYSDMKRYQIVEIKINRINTEYWRNKSMKTT